MHKISKGGNIIQENDTEIVDEGYEDIEEKSDSVDVLLRDYENRKIGKIDDAAAMQAVVCIIIAVLLFGTNMLFPDIAKSLLSRIMTFSESQTEIFTNPIDFVISKL